MEPEPLVSRPEIEGIFFVITDISVNVQAIKDLLEEEIGGEDSEDDS